MNIRIFRPQEKAYAKRNYKIIYNNVQLGSIGIGQVVELDLDGPGELEFKIDMLTGSKKLNIGPNPPELITVSGKYGLSKSPIPFMLLFIFIAVYSINHTMVLATWLLIFLSIPYLLMITVFRNYWLHIKLSSTTEVEQA